MNLTDYPLMRWAGPKHTSIGFQRIILSYCISTYMYFLVARKYTK